MEHLTNTLRPNEKVFLVNEIIRLRVLNNTKVNFNELNGCSDVRMWLFTHSHKQLHKMYVGLIAELKVKEGR